MKSVCWFRNDLRVLDNPALHHCCKNSKEVIAIYFINSVQWQEHDDALIKINFWLRNLELLKNKSIIIVLIKPQFESKKNETKKGVVKNSDIHVRICDEIKTWFECECNCEVLNIIESPLKGPKGNTEFLITAKYQK